MCREMGVPPCCGTGGEWGGQRRKAGKTGSRGAGDVGSACLPRGPPSPQTQAARGEKEAGPQPLCASMSPAVLVQKSTHKSKGLPHVGDEFSRQAGGVSRPYPSEPQGVG